MKIKLKTSIAVNIDGVTGSWGHVGWVGFRHWAEAGGTEGAPERAAC